MSSSPDRCSKNNQVIFFSRISMSAYNIYIQNTVSTYMISIISTCNINKQIYTNIYYNIHANIYVYIHIYACNLIICAFSFKLFGWWSFSFKWLYQQHILILTKEENVSSICKESSQNAAYLYVEADSWESQSVGFTNKCDLPSTFTIFETLNQTLPSARKMAVFFLIGLIV